MKKIKFCLFFLGLVRFGLKEGIDLMGLGLMEMGSFNDWTWV